MNSNKEKTIMDIPRFPAPECFGKDKGKTGIISKRVFVLVNFSVKNRKAKRNGKAESRAGLCMIRRTDFMRDDHTFILCRTRF